VKLSTRDAVTFFKKPDATRAGILIYGADPMRVALKRQELLKNLLGPGAEEEMRLTRLAAADLRRDPAILLDAVKARGFFPGPRAVLVEEANDGAAVPILAALDDWAEGDAQIVVTAGQLKATSKLRKAFEAHSNAYAVGIYDDPPSRDEIEAVLARAGLSDIPGPVMADLVFPSLSYRTGPYAANGIPFADGYADYFTMLNERDGGIHGAPIKNPACETAYKTKQGVECYENLKATGPSRALVIQPLSTGITYQLIPKVSEDQIPLHSMGYGRTSAVNGEVFEWVFNFPATYWDQAAVFVKYIGEQEGGLDKLSGKKIALVYHNSAYGKEPIPTLEAAAEKFGFELQLLPVDHPGQEQGATWLQVRREQPDWVLMWGWGVMNQVAIQEAASIRFPMDHFLGVWWSGSENDVLPAGMAADGYKSGAFHAPGGDFPVHDDIRTHVYDKDLAQGERDAGRADDQRPARRRDLHA